MSKSLSRTLYLLSILAAIVGGLLLARAFAGHTTTVNGTVTYVAHGGLAALGSTIGVVSVILALVAWIGALVRMAQLGHWVWFVFLILFSGITMLLYIFFGPKYPSRPPMPVTTPPYGNFGD